LIESVNDAWKNVIDNLEGYPVKIRKQNFYVYKVDTSLLKKFENKIKELKPLFKVDDLLKAIHLNFLNLRTNSFERILLDESKNKNIKNDGLILPIVDPTKPDFKIDFKDFPSTQTKEYLEDLADTIDSNIDSIDTQLFPLLKILKKKLIRVVENGKDVSPNKDWFNIIEYDPELLDDLQDSIDTLNLVLPIGNPEIKDTLNSEVL